MAVEKDREDRPTISQNWAADTINQSQAEQSAADAGVTRPVINDEALLPSPDEAALALADSSEVARRQWWPFLRDKASLSRPVRFRLTVEGTLYSLIILVAVFTRLWDLDFRALHHDEGVHAFYSWRYFYGDGYTQEPWKHGPLLYHVTALSFWLFGPNEFTARLPAALLGIVTCALPLLVRRELGRWGALTASFLLAVSPTFLYFSRFIREDIFMAVCTFLLFAGLVRFVRQPSARWWYVSCAALGLLFCTKEASYFYTVLFLGFIFFWTCWQLAPRLVLIFGVYSLLAIFAFFFVASLYTPPPIPFDNYTGPALGNYVNALVSHPIFWTSLALLLIGLAVAWFAFKEVAVARRDFLVATGRAAPGVAAAKTLFLPYQPGSPAYAIGWLGRHWRTVGGGLLLFFGIYSVLFTGFFSNAAEGEAGLISGLWYWMAQQGVERGGQPWYYYLFMLPLYEPLALMFGTLGGGYAIFQFVRHNRRHRAVRRMRLPLKQPKVSAILPKIQTNDDDELDDLEKAVAKPLAPQPVPPLEQPRWKEVSVPLSHPGSSLWPTRLRREEHPYFVPLLMAAWAFGSLFFYTWASEKMPWLTIHIALPFILLTAYFFQPIWMGLERFFSKKGEANQLVLFSLKGRSAFWTLAGGVAFTIGLAYMMGLFLTSSATKINYGGYQYDWLLIWIPPLLMLLFWGLGSLLLGSRTAIYITLGVVFGMLSLFLIRTGFSYAYQQGDIPVEMGIYTQTAPDLQRTVRQVDNTLRMTPEAYTTPILYDDELRTPMDFYLRDYKNVRKAVDFTAAGLQSSGITNLNDYPIIMLTTNKLASLDDNQKRLFETNYVGTNRVFRWWFAEEPYRNFDQADQRRIAFLLNKASKVTVADTEGKLIIKQGDVLSDEKLKQARDARGHVLERLYSGNGGNNLALNLTEATRSTANLANSNDFARLWRFVFFREQVQPLGHYDFTIYVRNDYIGLFRQFGDLVPYPISQP